MLLHLLSASLTLALALSNPVVERAAFSPSATLDSGVVFGTSTSLPTSKVIVNKFLGIPFAAPPVRFSPPENPIPWSKPLHTTAQKPSCVQQFNYPEAARDFTIALFDTPPPPAGESEDCLYINVYAPSGGKGLAVMFWIYGGSVRSFRILGRTLLRLYSYHLTGNLQFGSNSVIQYDGTSFVANQDVIIVQPNYRTNGIYFAARMKSKN